MLSRSLANAMPAAHLPLSPTSDPITRPPRSPTPTDASIPRLVALLQLLNIANLAFYCLNLLLIYLSITGIFGETNTALSSKYQTLVTPSGWAFSIWVRARLCGRPLVLFLLSCPLLRGFAAPPRRATSRTGQAFSSPCESHLPTIPSPSGADLHI